MNNVSHSLDPIYNQDSQILILGTMPSVKSREIGFYYSHPQNRFFKVLSIIFNEELPVSKEGKIRLLNKYHIALFDVLKSCEIKGSSDGSIKNIEVNDFNSILTNSQITTIFTTGKKAYNLYQRYCYPKTKIQAISLPSTSSANIANYSLEQLVEQYSIIKKYIK